MRRLPMFQGRSYGPAVALAALLLAACQAPAPEVAGWRRLTGDEVRALTEARRAEHPEQPPPSTETRGDFNGDGHEDRVVLLVNETEKRFAPYVFDGAGAPPVELAPGDTRERLYRYSLLALPSGAREAMCGDGALDSSDCRRGAESMRSPVIVFFEVDHDGSLFLWNGAGYAARPMP